MANDRVRIICERCGATTFLTKYLPSYGAYLEDDYRGVDQKGALVDFYQNHIDCTPTAMDLGSGTLYSVVTEAEYCRRGGIVGERSRLEPTNPPERDKALD